MTKNVTAKNVTAQSFDTPEFKQFWRAHPELSWERAVRKFHAKSKAKPLPFAILPDRTSHKIGFNEIPELQAVLSDTIAPLAALLKDKAYWASDLKPESVEYKFRDGFIPHSHNCGGLMLSLSVPKCEEYDWRFLEFGQCDECGRDELGLDRYGAPKQCGYNGDECASESDGHLDAHLRIWLKFEGLAPDGTLSFFLCAEGGNEDAPYFRQGRQATLFERSFEAKSIAGVRSKAQTAVRALLKELSK